MRDLDQLDAIIFAPAQALSSVQPSQDDLDIDPQWLRDDRRRQRDRERKRDERDTDALIEEIRRQFRRKRCACGCGSKSRRRSKYASDECRSKARRERDKTRKAEQRAEALRQIREAEGIAERECACGCGQVFPVEDGSGRPREYATANCRWRATKRAARELVRKTLSTVTRPPM